MNKVECKLECNHSVRLTITADNCQIGDVAYCRFDNWQTIVDIYYHEWRVICPSCHYTRWMGQSKKQAWRQSNVHNYMRGGHKSFATLDTITKTGGTPTKKLVAQHLFPRSERATVAPLPPPF